MIYPTDLKSGDDVYVIIRDRFVNRDTSHLECEGYEFDAEDVVAVWKDEY